MSMPPPPPPSDPVPPPPPGWQQGGSMPSPPGYRLYPADAPMPMKQGNSGMAVASLVCSLVGLVPCFWFLQVMGLLGTIFGFIGLKQTKNNERGGRSLAIAGIIIGIVLVVACIAFWIYVANANCVRNGNSFNCTTN
ncbi:MAG: DUF4190 domain-containing protein [Ilumatobacteraceae bacterium]